MRATKTSTANPREPLLHSPSSPSYRRRIRTRRGLASGASIGAVAALTAISLAMSPALASAAPPAIDLGTATAYSVLAGSTVTNTGATSLQGSLGLYPGSAVADNGALSVGGERNISNNAALQAQADLGVAFTNAEGRQPTGVLEAGVGNLTLTPGVYKASASVLLSGTMTLNGQGNPDSFFIFQIPASLTTAPNASVVLINGAQQCNVFWQVGASAKLDTGTSFIGTIMAYAQINLLTGATLQGRALAQTAQVTLDSNVITAPTCNTGTTIPGTTIPGTTIPGTTIPGTTVPGTTVPGTTVPGTTVPGTTVPGTTIPGTTIPGTTAPGTTIPGTTIPATTIPATTVPATTIPGTTVPGTTIPGTTVPGTTVPGTTIPGTTIPGTTVPGTTVPATTIPATTVPATTAPATTAPATTTTAPATTSTSTKKATTPAVAPRSGRGGTADGLANTGLSTGPMAGIAVATALVIFAGTAMVLHRRHRSRRENGANGTTR